MKNKVVKALICLLLIMPYKTYGQSDSINKLPLPSLEIGLGTLSYFGDLRENNINPLGYILPGYSFGLEYKIFRNIGLNLNILKGSVQYSQRDINHFKNFKSSVNQINLLAKYYFDNDIFLKKNSLFSPYLGIGIGYFSFNPMGDLKDSNGQTYIYWSDGTIRDLTESEDNEIPSKILKRDYNYESQLNDSINNYKKSSITLPLIAGLKFKLSRRIETNVGISYYFTQTDFLDNTNMNQGKDKILYTSLSVNYNFGIKKSAKEAMFSSIDFSLIETEDGDNDGVPDMQDDCQHTIAETKVNAQGCPLDSDNDGVPDYLDKEVNSSKGTLVNSEGTELTDQVIQEKLAKDTLIDYKIDFERIEVKDSNYSNLLEKTIMIGGKKLTETVVVNEIPNELKVADFNHDGQIKSDEIMKSIDAFFDGDPRITVDVINRLIDYFFNN